MIKRFSVFIIVLVLILIANYSCERDDLCPETTQTTARLIITAFDVSMQDDRKNIFNLRIQGVDNDEALEGYNVAAQEDSLILPLRTNANVTQYKLHQNYVVDDNDTPDDPDDDIIEGNEDIITINYITEDVYVSRACGFKTIFTDLSITIEDDGNTWIQGIQAETNNPIVEDETGRHFKLLH